MQVGFCRFTESGGTEIIINPLSVRYISVGGPGQARLCFDKEHTVTVRGSPREVQRILTAVANQQPEGTEPAPLKPV